MSHKRLYYKWTAFKLEHAESLSVGMVLTTRTIRKACEEGILSYDFGHGDAEYKRFWATDSHDVNRAVVGRGFCGSLIVFSYAFVWWLAKHKRLLATYRRLRRKLTVARDWLSSTCLATFALL